MEAKAQQLIENCLIFNKPISYCKETESFNDKYWKLHGKGICKRELIKKINDLIYDYKIQCVINPLDSYLFEPLILEKEKMIEAISKY